MRIDDLSVSLRARNPWEAFDLGIALARHTGANLFVAFALPFLACMLLVNILAWGHPTAAFLFFWWFKPAFDRIALHVLAQTVFGVTPSWRTTLKNLRQIPRTGLLHALTLGRFDFARSFHLAVLQLEGQTGKSRRERIAVLDRTARRPAVWLTIVIIQFSYVLLLGLDGLLDMVSPPGMHFSLHLGEYFSSAAEGSILYQHLFNAAFALMDCLLEPLYVAAGFALYLSRRTVLEGWDLEVAFKRMTQRIETASVAMARIAAVLLTALLLHGAAGNDALAQTANPAKSGTTAPDAALDASPATANAPSPEKQLIAEILKGADFNQYEDRKLWRRKTPLAPNKIQVDDGWLKFAQMMAEVLRFAVWIAAIGFIGWLLYYLAQRLGWLKEVMGKRAGYKPDVLFGLDLRAASLPDDIPAAARALLAQGEMRAALSLLYRGALRVLIHE
ncbi:MAG: hypothetical protein ABIS45_13915, partial [Burkholderiales bacterium]